MSLIDLIRGQSRTVAKVAGIAVATPESKESGRRTVATVAGIAVATSPEAPTDTIGIVSSIDRIIINSSFATAIPAIPATDPADPPPLPPALIDAAVRVCVELHNDGPEAIAAMLADLAAYPPDSWPWLTSHFTAQLPPIQTATPPATCGACRHSRPTTHPAILACAAGVQSGLPIGGRWHSDQHDCPEFIDRTTGATRRTVKTDPRPTQTETFNPDPFSFLET